MDFSARRGLSAKTQWARLCAPATVVLMLVGMLAPAVQSAAEATNVDTATRRHGGTARTQVSVEGGTPLTVLLHRLQDRGLRIVWSDVLVRAWMRVDEDATFATAYAALTAVLSPFDLKAESGPGGTWLVVRDKDKRDAMKLGGIYGRVVDVTTGEGVKGAIVQLGRQSTAATTGDGRFRFYPVTASDYELRVQADAYERASRVINVDSGVNEVYFELVPELPIGQLALEDVLVVASRYDLYSLGTDSSHFLSREDIERLPHLADDSSRALHRLPGVAAGDWSARFHLRGGLENEVSLVVDGLELFDPFHMRDLFSPLSVIDANVIENTELYSGGFSAKYGDHMSGVIKIDTMEGGSKRENEIGVSFVNAFARSQGQFGGERGRWLVSARRGYLDLLVDRIDNIEGEFKPRYYDVFAKFDYDVSDTLNIAANLLAAKDDVDYLQDDFDHLLGEGKSSYAWLTITNSPSESLLGTTILSVGQVDRDSELTEALEPSGEFSFADNRREVRVAGVKTDWEWLAGDRNVISWGAELRNLDANYDYLLDAVDFDILFYDGQPRIIERASQLSPDGDEIGAWLSHRIRATDNIVWEAGLRWDKQTYTDLDDQTQWSPRVNLLWSATKDTELRLAWGRYFQPQRIDELQVEDGVENFFNAQRSTHQIVSLSHRFSDQAQIRLEAYRKEYDSVRPRYENVLNRYETVAEVQPDRVLVDPETSLARGVEVSYKQQINDNWEWWGAYTWARVEDSIDGRDVPRNWDQRNALSAALNWHTQKWNANLTYVHHSGWPTTELDGSVFVNEAGDMIGAATFDEVNDDKLGAYHRVDLRVTRTVPVKNGEFRWFVEVYNLFDSGNDCCVTEVTLFGSIDGGVGARAELDSWMPRLPSFGFSWTF